MGVTMGFNVNVNVNVVNAMYGSLSRRLRPLGGGTRLQFHLCAHATSVSTPHTTPNHTTPPNPATRLDTLAGSKCRHDCATALLTDVTHPMAAILGRLGCRSFTGGFRRRNHTPSSIGRNGSYVPVPLPLTAPELPTDRLKRPPPAAVSGARFQNGRHVA